MFHLSRECEASDLSALEQVLAVDEEKNRLEEEAELLVECEMTPDIEQRLNDVYERLDQLDASTSESRAATILHGLGFTKVIFNYNLIII